VGSLLVLSSKRGTQWLYLSVSGFLPSILVLGSLFLGEVESEGEVLEPLVWSEWMFCYVSEVNGKACPLVSKKHDVCNALRALRQTLAGGLTLESEVLRLRAGF